MTLSQAQIQAENFLDHHAFSGADGTVIKDYDDVRLTRPLSITMSDGFTAAVADKGTIATVTMHSDGPISIACLECYLPDGSFGHGYEECGAVVLHRTAEQKAAGTGGDGTA